MEICDPSEPMDVANLSKYFSSHIQNCRNCILLATYSWGRGVPDHARYYAGEDVVEYQLGFGALPNHHCILESLDYVYPIPPYDDTMVDRFHDPGAGAFTYVRCLRNAGLSSLF